MRVIRGKVGVVAALVAAIALALSALVGLGSRPASVPTDGPWAIQLTSPEGDWASCLDDPAIAGASNAGSTVTSGTAPGATEADVRRVLDCLSATMTGGTVQVGQVSQGEVPASDA